MSRNDTNAISQLLKKCRLEHQKHYRHVKDWDCDMENGAFPYRKPIAQNTRRINLNGVINHILPHLDDLENYDEATYKAIENCGTDQSATRKHIREAAISHLKSLSKRFPHLKETLKDIQRYKLRRTKDPKQPVIRPKHIDQILDLIWSSKRDSRQKSLDTTLLLTLFHTGMRISEVAGLTIDDVDLEGSRIYINHSKGGKSRVIAINKELKPSLEKYIKEVRAT